MADSTPQTIDATLLILSFISLLSNLILTQRTLTCSARVARKKNVAYIADAVRTAYEKVLYRGSVPELLQLYHMSQFVYWTTSDIQEIVDDAVKTDEIDVSIAYGLTCRAYRQGKMVTVNIMGSNTSTVPSRNNNVGTMPSGWRPLKDIQGPLNVMNGTGAAFSVNANGQMQINQFTGSVIPAGNYWAGSMTYITN